MMFGAKRTEKKLRQPSTRKELPKKRLPPGFKTWEGYQAYFKDLDSRRTHPTKPSQSEPRVHYTPKGDPFCTPPGEEYPFAMLEAQREYQSGSTKGRTYITCPKCGSAKIRPARYGNRLECQSCRKIFTLEEG